MEKVHEVLISDFGELKKQFCEIENEYIFRGLASADWRLKTSIHRHIENSKNRNPLILNTSSNIFIEFKNQLKFLNEYEKEIKTILGIKEHEDIKLDDSTFIPLQALLQHYGIIFPKVIGGQFESLLHAGPMYDLNQIGPNVFVFKVDYPLEGLGWCEYVAIFSEEGLLTIYDSGNSETRASESFFWKGHGQELFKVAGPEYVN